MVYTLLNTDYADSSACFIRKATQFLVGSVGWNVFTTISGETDSQDQVLYSLVSGVTSSGTTVSGGFCIRLKSEDSYVNLFGYDNCTVVDGAVTDYDGEVYDLTYSKVFCPATEFKYWLFADETHIKFVFRDFSDDNFYHGYLGLIESVYDAGDDLIPILSFGTTTSGNNWEDGLSCTMRASNNLLYSYKIWVPYSLDYASSLRVPQAVAGVRPILYYEGLRKEVRGVPKGVLKIPNDKGGNGTEYITSSGTYYAFNRCGAENKVYMYGPVEIGA